MPEDDNDAQLLAAYVRDHSDAAFAALVRRHVNFVYAAALRQVNGDAHLAQDVAQLVFTDLARKARRLTEHRALAGWLFTSTRFAAAKVVRGEQRRRAREQEAMIMNEEEAPGETLEWERVRPVLDDALAELKARDREAILLRFLQGLDFARVGARLALTDNAARMCTDRALDKLRERLARRGITSTSAALAVALAGQAAVAAPVGLTTAVTGTALAGAAVATTATFTFMSLTKVQVALLSGVVVSGTGTLLVQERLGNTLHAELAAQPIVAAEELTRLQQENQRLHQATRAAAALTVGDAEWAKLQEEAIALRNRMDDDARLRRQEAAAARLKTNATLGLKELDRAPVVSGHRQAPRYPVELREQGIGGDVVVEFVINPAGDVVEAKVIESSHPGFEMPALQAVAAWRFEPGLKGGRTVNTRVSQRLQFDPSTPAEPPANWF